MLTNRWKHSITTVTRVVFGFRETDGRSNSSCSCADTYYRNILNSDHVFHSNEQYVCACVVIELFTYRLRSSNATGSPTDFRGGPFRNSSDLPRAKTLRWLFSRVYNYALIDSLYTFARAGTANITSSSSSSSPCTNVKTRQCALGPDAFRI